MEKNQRQKSRDTIPLNLLNTDPNQRRGLCVVDIGKYPPLPNVYECLREFFFFNIIFTKTLIYTGEGEIFPDIYYTQHTAIAITNIFCI
jgi:hypothetical protein